MKVDWCSDCVYEKFGLDLGVEKVFKQRFENPQYKELKSRIYDGLGI